MSDWGSSQPNPQNKRNAKKPTLPGRLDFSLASFLEVEARRQLGNPRAARLLIAKRSLRLSEGTVA
jgi:hypothetical protein